MAPKWIDIKFAIQRELRSRDLAQPRIRLSVLDRLESLLVRTYPGFKSDPAVLLTLEKQKVEGALARLKDNGKLNGAERSVLNNVFQALNGTLGATQAVAEGNAGSSYDAAEGSVSTKSDELADVPVRIRAAREVYRPACVECLLIGEAPPDALDRYFYYPAVPQHDHLFLGVMEVLFPREKEAYLAGARQTSEKRTLLERFRDGGFFLLDVSDEPLSLARGSLRDAVPGLLRRVEETASKDTPIILIKKTTFEVAYQPLKEAGYRRLYSEGIPFPGQGWQPEFREGFRDALGSLGSVDEDDGECG